MSPAALTYLQFIADNSRRLANHNRASYDGARYPRDYYRALTLAQRAGRTHR